jgi:hypothetical protein
VKWDEEELAGRSGVKKSRRGGVEGRGVLHCACTVACEVASRFSIILVSNSMKE